MAHDGCYIPVGVSGPRSARWLSSRYVPRPFRALHLSRPNADDGHASVSVRYHGAGGSARRGAWSYLPVAVLAAVRARLRFGPADQGACRATPRFAARLLVHAPRRPNIAAKLDRMAAIRRGGDRLSPALVRRRRHC